MKDIGEDGGKSVTTLIVEGGHELSGVISVEGNKNSALPLLVACLLTEQSCRLANVPRIKDVGVMIELLQSLGAEVHWADINTLEICCQKLTSAEPDRRLVGRLRGSVLLLGPLLARLGHARLAPPGGDFPARRTISVHLQALRALGARDVSNESNESYELDAPAGLHPTSIYLEEASVTGTEVAILTAAAVKGTTEIRHAACEPHVSELCEFLRSMGAEIEGEGTPFIKVSGRNGLSGASHRLRGDYVEAGSWAVLSAVTGGQIEITGVCAQDLEPITSVLLRMNVGCTVKGDRLTVSPSELKAIRQVTTAPWPGFPSDMVSLVSVLATQARGRTLIHDWMYELRLFALEQLSGMGANLFICDPHRMIVDGPRKLKGRDLDTRDLRSGMALIASALAADGTSRIGPLETVERGYADLVDRLIAVGARVSVESAPES